MIIEVSDVIAASFVVSIPPTLAAWLSYRVGRRAVADTELIKGKSEEIRVLCNSRLDALKHELAESIAVSINLRTEMTGVREQLKAANHRLSMFMAEETEIGDPGPGGIS